jgi:branched-chain amino acid transport system substrate-binding protein
LLHYDTASDHRQTINVVRKLIQEDKVKLICGPVGSQEAKVVFPIIEEAKVIVMSPSSLAPGLTDGLKYCFRNTAIEDKMVPLCVKKAKEMWNIKKAAIFQVQDDPYGKSMGDVFKNSFEAHGVEVTIVLPYRQGETDFSARVTRALATKPDTVVLAGLYNEQALLMLETRRQGFKGPFLDGGSFSSAKIMEIAGDAFENSLFVSSWSINLKAAQYFVNEYRKHEKKDPEQSDANTYDIIRIFNHAIKKTGGDQDTDALSKAIRSIKDFPGPSGVLGFESTSGDAIRKGYPTIIKNKQWVILGE